SAADCRLVSYDFSTIGNDTGKIELDYYGHAITITTQVIKEVVDSITVNYLPVKTDYFLNDTDADIDWTGFDAVVAYNSGVTYKLQDLIENKDSDTPLTFDSSKAGDGKIVVAHTHGDVTKEIEIPVKISDATVDGITLTGPNQTTFYKDVAVDDAEAYKKGLLVNAKYSDGTTKVLQSGFTVAAKDGNDLDTTQIGDYVYVVTYGGKTAEYTLKVVERNVTGLAIKTYPTTTTFVKGTDFSADGIEIEAVYDSGEKDTLASGAYTVDSSAFKKDEVGSYTITINATVAGKALSTTYTAEVRDKTVFGYNDLEWHSVVFGQSIDATNKPKEENGIITVEQGEGKGKCTDDGQDGIAYYYTVLNPQTDNFEITAKVKVDYFITKLSPDNQEGFGIMVRDSINTDGDSSIYYSNAMSVGGYYGRYNVFGRHGILSQDETLGKVNDTYNGNKMGNLSEQILKDNPKTFILTLKKDNTGVYATMKNEDGSIVDGIDNVMFYLPANTFSSIEDEKMYVGFMAARGAKIEIDTSTIQMTITSASADAPQTFAPEKPVKPSVSMASLSETADESYEFKATVNTKGLLTIKKDGETVVSQQIVEKGTHSFPTTLTVGANKFQMYFEPDGTQNIDPKTPVTVNATVTRKVYTNPENVIYASPSGTKDASGTKDDPLELQTALTYCEAGQTIYVLEGIYNLSKTTGVWAGNNGTENARKQLVACPDNTGDVIFDFANKGAATGNTFDFSGDYWYVKGIKFLNGGGVRVGGDHNILELCDFAGHTNSGLSISRTDNASNIADWPSYNEIINCNSYSNRDKSDNNADGFAAKLTCGVGNVFKGCVAAYNADDGWDLFSKGGTGAIGEVKIYDCVCFGNGFAYDEATGTVTATKGDGNGFKMGGSGIAVNHQIYNSYSFGNKSNGFTNNSDPMGVYENCVGYNNGGSNLELHTYTGVTPQFVVTDFKSFADDSYTDVAGLTATGKESKDNCINSVLAAGNFFYDGKKFADKDGVEITAENFESLAEFAGYVNGGIASVKRDADGNLVLGGFLKFVQKQEPEPTPEGKVEVIGDGVDIETYGVTFKDSEGNIITNNTIYVRATAQETSSLASRIELGSEDKVQYFDVSLVDKDGNKVTLASGKIALIFSYPDGTNGSDYSFKVYHGLDQDAVEQLETNCTEAGVKVMVESLSPFAVVYTKNNVVVPSTDDYEEEDLDPVKSVKTGDDTPVLPLMLMMFVSAAVCGAFFFKKREEA
ncbi:MAG: hypothetical protein NC086_02030, partial [Alistipes sp.]|nr:hypothetical protein [Alistipes sp.]